MFLGSPHTDYRSSATLTPGFFLSYPELCVATGSGTFCLLTDIGSFMLSDLVAVRGINNTEAAQSITLASFEASLAKLLASMFWICTFSLQFNLSQNACPHLAVGHVEPSHKLANLDSTQTFNTVTTLVKGQTTAQEIFSQARLNVSSTASHRSTCISECSL